jgi:methyltransferase, FkbM family
MTRPSLATGRCTRASSQAVVANQAAGLCLDVGANRGDYARAVLERTACSVVAFEPLPSTFEQLAKLAHEHPSRFEAIEAAVGDREGTTTLHVDPANSALASTSVDVRHVPYVHPAHTVDVRLRTLDAVWDALLAPRFDAITLLKIDVEGCEHEVLRGAQRLLAIAPPTFVQVEMNWHHLFTGTTLRMLAAHLPGYRLLQLVPYGCGYVPRDVNDARSNMYAFTNFVFVRRDVRLPGLTYARDRGCRRITAR